MNERFLAVDAASVKAIIADLKARYPELEEDAGLFADVLEGETNLFELIDQALEIKLDADEMEQAIKGRIEGLQVRRKRSQDKSEAMKAIIQQLMTLANQQKVVRPVATVSITKPRESVLIVDADQLPQGLYELVRKPKTEMIAADLKRGEEVPGAKLETGHPGLTIRVK